MGASLPPLRIPITTSGDRAVLATFGRIGQAGGALEKQFARSSLQVASIGTAAIQAGEVGGSALTKLVNIGGSLALTMGIGGPVVAALGVAAIAMVGFFNRARSEMEETARTAETELRRIRKSTDLAGLNAQATRLFAGDPEAVADPAAKNKKAAERRAEAERQGVERLRAERDAITQRIQGLVMREIELRGKAEPAALAKVREELTKVYVEQERNSKLLAEIEPRYEAASKRAKEYGAVMGEVEEAARQMAKRLEDADPAKRAEAISKTIDAMATLSKHSHLRGADLQALDRLERALSEEVARGNATYERRAAIASQLARIEEIRKQDVTDQRKWQADEIGRLAEIAKLHKARDSDIAMLTLHEKALNEELKQGATLERERYAAIQSQLAKIKEAQKDILEWRGPAPTPTVRPRGAAPKPGIPQEVVDAAESDARQAGAVMGNAIVEGFAAAFDGGGVGGALATFGGNVLSGLGRIFAEMGASIGLFGSLMEKLRMAIFKNPLLAGGAAVIVGAALMGLGKSLGASARSGGTGASGGSLGNFGVSSAATDSITNIRISTGAVDAATGLTPKTPMVFNIIGPADPQAQRGIAEIVENAMSRGYLGGLAHG